ncbi:unnamed protein product [Sphagnum jensenii]|uniref:PROP1-like PPR domain-containing protein n=1 Tax=Sphagnum jensenii TaxID=128206 RepID=A0ABP0WMT7_9BRYO
MTIITFSSRRLLLLSSFSSRRLSHSLAAVAAEIWPSDSENWLDDATSVAESVAVQGDASNENSHQRSQKSRESGRPQDCLQEKFNSKFEVETVTDVPKLFNLLKKKRFNELLVAHDAMVAAKSSACKEMSIATYSRLMTQCGRELGPETVLPIFKRMLQAGVTPDVVSYTIVIQAFMEMETKQGKRSSESSTSGQGVWATRALELLREMRAKGLVPNMLTYKPIIAWLAAKGNVTLYHEFTKYMDEDGVPQDGVFKKNEIQFALSAGDLERAKGLYLAAKKENVQLVATLDAQFILEFATADKVAVVVDLLPKVLPNVRSIRSISAAFRCLGKHGQHETALQCFAILKEKGTSAKDRSFVLTAYILGYTKRDKLDDAVKAFQEVEERFQVKALASMFNILIDFSCRQGEISRGLDFLDEMQQRGLVLSHFSFNPFIREFARWTMIEEAFEMKAAMHRVSVQPSVVTYHSLIGICVKLGDMERAHNLFLEMKECGVATNTQCFNPLIIGFATQGRFDRALSVLKDMESAGVKPDVTTYRFLIFACSRTRNQEKAVQLYDEMQEHGIKPNQSIFTVMATVFAKCGNLDRGIKMVRAIEKSGERAGTETKSAILSGLALAGRLDEAFALYDEIKKEGVLPRAYAVGTLVAAVGKAGDLDRMFELFEESRSDNQWPNLNQRQRAEHLNIRCINVVLGCIRNNQLGRAIKFLKQVKEEGIADEGVLFEKIFLHISNGGEDENEMCWLDVEDGFTVVAAMRELGLRPSRISLEALLDGCAAMSDPEQAQRVVQEMEQEGLCLNIFSMIRLFRAYIAGEDEERALSLLNEMPASDLQDPDVRVLILQTLQPHYVAAADSPEAARAPETLPRVRARLDELLGTDLIPGTRIRL